MSHERLPDVPITAEKTASLRRYISEGGLPMSNRVGALVVRMDSDMSAATWEIETDQEQSVGKSIITLHFVDDTPVLTLWLPKGERHFWLVGWDKDRFWEETDTL